MQSSITATLTLQPLPHYCIITTILAPVSELLPATWKGGRYVSLYILMMIYQYTDALPLQTLCRQTIKPAISEVSYWYQQAKVRS